MIANKSKKRNESFIEGFVRWLTDWWADWSWILTSIVFITVVAMFVVIPGCSVSETKLKNGAELMSYEQLDQGVNNFAALLEKAKKDPYNGILYWDVLIKYSLLESQCAVIHLRAYDEVALSKPSPRNPCYRIQAGDTKFHFSNYTLEYQRKVSKESFDIVSASYHSMHPIEMDALLDKHADPHGGLTETVWHTEKLWEAYRNGVFISLICFTLRICSIHITP